MSNQPEGKRLPNDHLVMFTPVPGIEGRRASLKWSIFNGNPRATVFTNDPNDENGKGMIPAKMGPQACLAFIEYFIDFVKSGESGKFKFDCDGTEFKNNERQAKALVAELWCGRDKEGVYWISVLAPNRPKIIFYFKISDWHRFHDKDGVLDAARSSKYAAIAYLDNLKKAIQQHCDTMTIINKEFNTNTPAAGAVKQSVATTKIDDIDIDADLP